MSERDYSAVSWPWAGDPNWAAPREGATSDPADQENWCMECVYCALRFPKELEMHVVTAHGDEQHPGEKLALNLVWIGLGTPPEPSDA